MSDLTIRSRIRDYAVRFRDDFAAALAEDLCPGDVPVIDRIVHERYAERLSPLLAGRQHLVLDATEELKSYQGVEGVIGRLIELGVRRDHRLVAVGGGVIQDTTAFIASILYRGIGWIFYPSTLLAQGDSCIGSKTSVNFGSAKNQIGGFYPPLHVVIDLAFLDTLPLLELRSGLGEMAHYFLIAGEEDFARFRDDAPRALADRSVLRGLVARSLAIKQGFIERDEFDRKERQVLNYGHTFGHAIETLTDYRVPHGVAVCYGMDLANYVSVQLGLLGAETRARARAVLARIWEGVPLGSLDQQKYESALRKDKKNAAGKLGLILTRGFGQMFKELVPLDERFSGWLRSWFAEVV